MRNQFFMVSIQIKFLLDLLDKSVENLRHGLCKCWKFSDAPSFKSRPKNVEAEVGDTVTLSCDVDSYPEADIRWLLHEPGRIGVSA